MPTVVRLNRFPAGNLGGLLTRNPAASRSAHIALFMPPFKQQEVLLNIPMMPKKAIIDTGEMRPVLSMEGTGVASRWRLRIASRDSDGKNVWSPLTFANVWQDARICWGNGNAVPTTFARAWTDFWTAPFNRDLAAEVPIREYGWWYDNVYADKQRQGWAPKSARLIDRYADVRSINLSQWEPSLGALQAAHDRLDAIREKFNRFDHVRRELARRCRDDCANRGVAFVAVNHKAYMRAFKIATDLRIKLDAAAQTVDDVQYAARGLRDRIDSYCDWWAERRRVIHTHGSGSVTHNRVDNHHYWRDYLAGAFERFMRLYRGRFTDLISAFRKSARARLIERYRTIDEGSAADEYRTWQQKQLADGLKSHFCENAWTKTLVFRQITDDLAPWGTATPFPACDGVFTIPAKATDLPLPSYDDVFIVYNAHGEAFRMSAQAKFALFKNVSDKVKFLFVPGSENVYLTNGVRVVPVDDGCFASVLAELEAENIASFDGVAHLERMGYYLDRAPTMDMTRKEKIEPDDDRADAEDGEGEPDTYGDDDEEEEEEEEEPPDGIADLLNVIDNNEEECVCVVCARRCGCRDCFAATEEHEDEDGRRVPDCACPACQWISDHSPTRRHH
jgi:hypothetical protein